MGVTEIVVAGVSGTLGAVGSLAAAFVVGKKAEDANRETAHIQEKALAADQTDKFVQRLLERLDQLEREATSQGQRLAQLREDADFQIRQMRREHEEELQELRDRLDNLKSAHSRAADLIERLRLYVRQLRDAFRATGHAPPEAPPELRIDD